MKESLTPKQVARALEVSESSVKRWCDNGVIPVRYTAGGHRRIPLSGLVEFVRSSGRELVRPEVLGLPVTSGRTEWVIERAAEQFGDALIAGDEERARGLILDLYLAEHSLSAIFDLVIARAFHEIGDKWEEGEAEVYQEHRSGEIAQRILYELRTLLPTPSADASKAIGCSPEGDSALLATRMAEMILRECGWDAVSLGDNLPFATLAAAIKTHRPRLVWLSCTHLSGDVNFVRGYNELYDEFGLDVAFVVGGRALTEDVRKQMKYAAYCDTMQHLESFARSLPASGDALRGR